jgi:hypothetical protein
VDIFITEGFSILYRIGLGIIKLKSLELLELKASTKEELLKKFDKVISQPIDPHTLIKV